MTKTPRTKKPDAAEQSVAQAEEARKELPSPEEFKEKLSEKYGLPPHMWWKKDEKERGSGRVIGSNWILHHTGFQAIADQEGLEFGPVIVHEQPGRVITYTPSLSPTYESQLRVPEAIFSVLDIGATPQRTINFGRWSLTGSAFKRYSNGQIARSVTAWASASDGGPGDSVGYGSAFVGAHNRLFDRLVKAWIGATMMPLYSSEEAPEFAHPDAIQATEQTEETKPEPQTNPQPAVPVDNSPKASAAKQPTEKKTFAPPQAKAAQETKPPGAGDENSKEADQSSPAVEGSTKARVEAYMALPASERIKALRIEAGKAKNPSHLYNLWGAMSPVIQSLSEEMQQQAEAIKTDRRRELLQKGSFDVVESKEDEKTPRQVADGICGEIMKCSSMDELLNTWNRNLPVMTRIDQELFEQCKATKNQMKIKIGGGDA